MNRKRFDVLTRVLGEAPTRRALLPVLGSLLAAPLVGVMPGAAKKKRKKKTTLCFNGQTIQASKKKKKKLLKKGATPGACLEPVCTPSCPGNACGGGDGCGGICGCGQGAFCDGGICKSCDVTDAAGLQAALAAGGTVTVCPGRYIGNFSLTSPNLTLIGAGDGDDPATSTILDANGAGTVLEVEPPGKATLQRLRITGGAAAGGAGVVNLGELTLDDCTVTGNHSPGAAGGFNNFDTMTLNGCTVSGNSAGSDGGGIRNLLNSTVNVNNTDINGNTAGDQGGGVYNEGNLIFNQASKVRNNIANSGGGIFNDDLKGSVTLNDTSFSGNNPNNCIGC